MQTHIYIKHSCCKQVYIYIPQISRSKNCMFDFSDLWDYVCIPQIFRSTFLFLRYLGPSLYSSDIWDYVCIPQIFGTTFVFLRYLGLCLYSSDIWDYVYIPQIFGTPFVFFGLHFYSSDIWDYVYIPQISRTFVVFLISLGLRYSTVDCQHFSKIQSNMMVYSHHTHWYSNLPL